MKKILLNLLLIILLANTTIAQSYDHIEWQGKKVPSFTIEVYQNESITESAIKDYFEKMGFYAKKQKGISSYKEIQLAEIDSELHDVLVKVERKSKQEKDVSVVYFSMAKNYDQYISSTSDDQLIKKVKKFLNGFRELANEKALAIEIKNQEEKSKSAEKKLTELQVEKENLEQKILKLTQQKEDKIKEIDSQNQELENLKKALDNLIKKKKATK
ncbi:MAG: hypothetical protein ACK5BV_02230 [Bacteroidota bacterium]|jgi:hypothetical protein